jgi:hypothetical protein
MGSIQEGEEEERKREGSKRKRGGESRKEEAEREEDLTKIRKDWWLSFFDFCSVVFVVMFVIHNFFHMFQKLCVLFRK